MLKSIGLVLFEGIVVSISVLVIYMLLGLSPIKLSVLVNVFLAGFLVHIIYEYTGINLWYSIDYYKRSL